MWINEQQLTWLWQEWGWEGAVFEDEVEPSIYADKTPGGKNNNRKQGVHLS